MKTKKIIIVLALVLLLSATTYASVGVDLIQAYLAHDFNFRVDGQAWQPRDVDGSPMTPIVFNGRTYVPARALLEHKDVHVDWENETRTVILDFPEFAKYIDKATPVLYNRIALDVQDPDYDPNVKRFQIVPNPEYTTRGIEFTSQIAMDLSADARIFVNGREWSAEELASVPSESLSLSYGKIQVDYNQQTKSAGFIKFDGVEGEAIESKIDVELEISGPPFKIKLTIKF